MAAQRWIARYRVALNEHVDAVKDLAPAYEVRHTVLVARQGGIELSQALGSAPAGLPFTLALNRRGQIVGRRVDAVHREDLDAFVAKVLR